ncbi:hypothetical protein SEA_CHISANAKITSUNE_6 [Gordonia phage ChisanaKitsune]|uniref:Uncharacterized protein n=1 Tax=Gordonia phage ChisanaKitsune TaxID=2871538 RepID=A0AAE8BY18_9CAUD|nr:hypothetical protein PQD15_gp006 [Gordonia phage ChisanaKitsune]QZE10780.1 hypothetical protein SEA_CHISANAKITSUNE_6 [Gordonia phage ChisanaKitsune]
MPESKKRKTVTFTNMHLQIGTGRDKLNIPYAVCDTCGATLLGNLDDDLIRHKKFHAELWAELDAKAPRPVVRKRSGK